MVGKADRLYKKYDQSDKGKDGDYGVGAAKSLLPSPHSLFKSISMVNIMQILLRLIEQCPPTPGSIFIAHSLAQVLTIGETAINTAFIR